jgi:hypothetical protein
MASANDLIFGMLVNFARESEMKLRCVYLHLIQSLSSVQHTGQYLASASEDPIIDIVSERGYKGEKRSINERARMIVGCGERRASAGVADRLRDE